MNHYNPNNLYEWYRVYKSYKLPDVYHLRKDHKGYTLHILDRESYVIHFVRCFRLIDAAIHMCS